MGPYRKFRSTRNWRNELVFWAGVAAVAWIAGLGGVRPVLAQGPVKIGFIYADSGSLAQLGLDMRDGFLLYWSEVGNRAGGRAVEILTEGNTTSKVDEALTKARKLVERDGVHLLAGVTESPVAYALGPYVTEKKIPLIILNAGADGLTQARRSEYIFRSSTTGSQPGHPFGEWAYKQGGYRKAVIMASDFTAGYEQIGGLARTFIEAGGRVIQEIYPPLGTADFAPFLTQIKRDADVVMVFFAGADGLRFVNQYAEYGLKDRLPLIGLGWLVDEVILPKQGDNALGIVTALHWSAALDTPANKRFIEAYAAKYKRPATIYSEQAYVGAQLIAKALDATKGNVENQRNFLDELRKVEGDAPRGKVSLDSYHNVIHPIYIRRVEKRAGALQNTVIATYPNVGQFWKWAPEAYLAMPSYVEMKGKWTK